MLLAWAFFVVSCLAYKASFVWDDSADALDSVAQLAEAANDAARHALDQGTPFELVVRKPPAALSSPENATFLVLCRDYEVYELLETVQSVQDRYNHRFHHDWVFLNDDVFLDQFIVYLSLHIPHGTLTFAQVPPEHWLYPSWLNQTLAAEKRHQLHLQDVVYAQSESYRHMCRFYLGFFYKHPLVRQYQYYWRLEPGVRFYCDIDYDVFAFMRSKGKLYGFALSMFEYSATIPLLWDTVTNHFVSIPGPGPQLLDLVRNPGVNGTYNLCHFWLNFEIASLEFFQSPEYEAYFAALDRTGGFFYERWGDGPVHTLAVSWLLTQLEVWWFSDMGYYHPPYLQCPQGPQFVAGKCSCDQARDFTYDYLSCTPHILQVLGLQL